MKLKYVFLIGTALMLLTQCSQSPEISQWRGPDRTGIFPETNLLSEWPEDGPELIWKYEDLGCGYASVAVLEDKVITIATLDSISYVIAFNHDGDILYKKELGREWMENFPGMNSTPLIYDGLGYVQGGLGILYCFNADNGDIVWTKDLFNDFDGKNNTYGITENFVIDNDKLFVTPGGEEYNMIALNRLSGELIWKNRGNGELSIYGCPNIIKAGDKKYLINYTESSLFSVDPDTGEILWRFPLDSKATKANVPIYIDGYLYVMAGHKSGFIKLKIAEDGRSVDTIWRNTVFDSGLGDGIYLNGKFYAGSAFRYKFLGEIDPETGEATDTLKTVVPTTIVAADDMIYSYGFLGQLCLIKLGTNGLELVSSFEIGEEGQGEHCSHPVIKDGRLYIRYSNSLFVYNISAENSE